MDDTVTMNELLTETDKILIDKPLLTTNYNKDDIKYRNLIILLLSITILILIRKNVNYYFLIGLIGIVIIVFNNVDNLSII